MKIIKYFFLFFILSSFLFADVILKSSDSFIKGEPFIFEFEVSGSSIKFPKIEKIDQYIVQTLGSSSFTQVINGSYSDKITRKYQIFPTEEFIIPSFSFKINGKEIKSEAKKITKHLASKTKSDFFDLSISSSKKSLYIGEELILKLTFKYKKNLQITNLGFEQPHFENFWYKKLDKKNSRYEENGYVVQELDFLLFPQKSGILKIDPLKVEVQMIDGSSGGRFGFFSVVPKVVKVYSNSLEFDVKSLPAAVNLIGDFDIKASVDKTQINEGESVAYKVTISGIGNIDDISDKKIDINNAVIYDNKPKIQTEYTSKGYKGTFEKVYSIVPNNTITIPSQTIKYFDKNLNKVIEKSSESFKITVNKKQNTEKSVLQKSDETKKIEEKIVIKQSSTSEKITYFLLGILASILIFGLLSFVKIKKVKKNKEEIPLIKQIKLSKDKRELLKILVPYINKDLKLDEMIYKCESDCDFFNLKKEIIAYIKKIKI